RESSSVAASSERTAFEEAEVVRGRRREVCASAFAAETRTATRRNNARAKARFISPRVKGAGGSGQRLRRCGRHRGASAPAKEGRFDREGAGSPSARARSWPRGYRHVW